jgi:hypothetical protein
MKIIVNDKMQQGYSYELSEPEGKNFAPDFRPELSPQQILEYGAFEGKYITDCRKEFPAAWFENARLSPARADTEKNCFGVKSRLSLQEWQRRGWIIEPDPRGWFQWYCRYYYGRRLQEIDNRQIRRWKAFNRHRAQIEYNCLYGDLACRPRQRQALLQWAYNPFI